ncbi:transposase [Candidatus Methylomirabilis sp.]|uniref:REP-associated tyrosine transposase n=1 Tax=Candidatus Methylomirabilis sp. TaxID=2032687 RepID=UPI0030764BBB
MRYRRACIPGGSFFFTVVTEQRRPLFTSADTVGVLRAAFRAVRSTHPFEIDTMVVLPDHLYCIWTLPPGDADFATRWRLIKTWFTKHRDPALRTRPNPARTAKRNRRYGTSAIGNMRSGTKPMPSGMASTCISTRSSTGWCHRQWRGRIPAFTNMLRPGSIQRSGDRVRWISKG